MKTFDEIFTDKTKNGVKVQTSEYGKKGKYIIIDQGQSQIAGYTDREDGVFEELPVIVFGDHTRIIKYVDKPFFLGADGVKVLRSKDNNANYKYLYYALRSAKIPDTGYNRHFKWLKKVQINYPDNNRQEEIVKILDKVSDIMKNRGMETSVLDGLIKARFVEMFGDLANPKCKYKKYRLVDICSKPDDIKCGPFGTQLNKDEYQSSGVAVWEIPQINSGFKELPTHFVTEDKAKELIAYSLVSGDIAMSRKGNVGRCGLFPADEAPGIIHSDVLRIRVDRSRVNPVFMMYQLHFSQYVQHQIELVSSGAIMAGINVTKLKQIYIHLPDLLVQDAFATFVEQIDKLKVAVQKALDETQLLFDSLMQKYFG